MRKAMVLVVSAVAVVVTAILLVSALTPHDRSGFVTTEPNLYEGDLVFVDAANEYSDSHPDTGGMWVDWERDVWVFAFTSDLEVHKGALEAAGLDMDSGKHELVLVEYTFAELEAVQDLIHEDWPLIDEEWELIRTRVDASTNTVEVGVPWTDQDRAQRLIWFLAERYSFPAWSVATGAPPIDSDGAFGSSRETAV